MTRRAPGESSVHRDANGRWHGYVSMGRGPGGRRDRRHVTGRSRADVVAKVRELERRRDAGAVGLPGRAPTVEQWLRHWLNEIAVRRVRPSTWQGYESKVETRLIPELGHHRLDRLQPEDVESCYRRWAEDGLASSTVLQLHRILSRALKVAVQRGRVARNVCTLVDAPSLVRTEVEPFTAEEARRLLATAEHDRLAARWSVALSLGLRQGESLALQWTDIDLTDGLLRVRRGVQRIRGRGLVFDAPKSAAGRRTIALPPQLTDALRRHRAGQLEERLLAGQMWDDHDLVFCQPSGRPIDPGADWKAWKTLLRRAGLRDARLHDARHTAATLLLQQGVHPRVAMQILGHSQVSLTLGTYSHVVPEIARDAAERIGAALWCHDEDKMATNVAPTILDEAAGFDVRAGQSGWGGQDSNLRPRDYESPALTG
jgi:integrase